MPPANIALLALSVLLNTLFFWATIWHFRGRRLTPGYAALSLCSLAAYVAQIVALWPGRTLAPWAWALVPFYLAALALWLWTVHTTRGAALRLAFSRGAPDQLIARGPYRLVRHPFYVAYTIYWLCGCLATLRWWVALPSTAVVALYVAAARREERLFAAGPLAAAYAAYRRQTGMFLPKLRVRGSSPAR